jgi:hypothetical protein
LGHAATGPNPDVQAMIDAMKAGADEQAKA